MRLISELPDLQTAPPSASFGFGAVAAGVAVAFWPVWSWYFARVTDGSDEPWGLLALLTVAVCVARRKLPDGKPWQLAVAGGVIGCYAVTFHAAPPLLRAVLAVSAVAVLLVRAGSQSQSPVALWALLLLSLPVVPSLEFFLGYPLRLLVAESSVGMLNAVGFPVVREGAALCWAGEIVLVDAPCSGVKMIWAGFYFAAALAAYRGLRPLPTVLLLGAALAATVAANIARSTALFFKESHWLPLPEWTHPATGLAAFALAAFAILALASRVQRFTKA